MLGFSLDICLSLTLKVTVDERGEEEEGMTMIIQQSGGPRKIAGAKRREITNTNTSGDLGSWSTWEKVKQNLTKTSLLLQVLGSTLEHRHLMEKHGNTF